MHSGSCRLSAAWSPAWPGYSASSVAKLCSRMMVSHATSGEGVATTAVAFVVVVCGAVVVLARNWPRVSLCWSVRSSGRSVRVSCLLRLVG
ncbi:hypothetical protein I7I48_12023 [Histoplasma ohiense]|nr:hypothetical protein I7I48_12023 [Histoplasma ohiense (nom. inval.)]